jgi:anion transporter
MPMDHISPTAAPTLALVVAVVWIWVTNCLPLAVGCMVLFLAGIFLGLFNYGTFATAFGASPFVPMIGMFIVSMGASRTNIAKRVAYIFLSKLGRSPSLILLAISAATAVVSAFVSNLGTTIVMASISIAIMTELGEEKGTSGLGKAIMLSIPMFSMVGGMMLITGSPSTNMMGISMLENLTDKEFTVTYAQWASIGVICGLILIVPSWIVYCKSFKIQSKAQGGEKNIDIESFRQKLRDLGPFRGAELRWVIIVACMVVCMVTGWLNLPMASILFGLVTVAPFVGVVKPDDAFKSLPFDVLMLIGFSPIIANMVNDSKLGEWAVTNLFGWANGLHPFLIMLIAALARSCMGNAFANATIGIIGVVIVAFAPMVIANGLNPTIALLPAMLMGSCTTVLGVQTNVVLTYHYGYWNMKDPIVPGLVLAVIWPVVMTAVAYFCGPMFGMPILL